MAKILKGETRGRPGRWLLDFYDQDGKRRIKTFETQKAAKDARAGILKDVQDGTYRDPKDVPTLEAVALAWLRNKASYRPASVAQWENHVHRHILPTLGARLVTRISIEDVEAFRDGLLAKGLGPKTANKVLTTLAAIFSHAQRSVPALVNVAERAERARPRQEILDGDDESRDDEVSPEEIPSATWVNAAIGAMGAGVFRAYFMAAAMTGARPEELTALQWSNVDLEKREVRIVRVYSWEKTRAEREAGTVKGPRVFPPKTKAGRRAVPIPEVLAKELERWRKTCPASEDGLVFPRLDGSPLSRSMLRDELAAAVARASEKTEEPLGWFPVYSLRHFYASTLAAQGRPATEVAAYLGHKDAHTTLTVYQHWFPKTRTSAAEDVAESIFGAQRGASGSKTVSGEEGAGEVIALSSRKT
jgi:integrase